MDQPTDLISRLIFRAVDDVSATLRGISAEMDAVEARVRQTGAAFSAGIGQLEAYEVKVAALSKEMSAGGALAAPVSFNGNAQLVDQYGQSLETVATKAALAETQITGLNGAENGAAAAGARAQAGSNAAATGAAKAGAAAESARAHWKSFSTSLLLIGGIAAGIIGVSARLASRFQADMELIRTQAHASQLEVNAMSQAVLNMATDVGTGPDQLAAGLYHIESSGIRGALALRILRAAAEGAKVGHADLEAVTQSLIAVTVSHIGGIHNQVQAMGLLNAVVGAGDLKMQQLAESLGTGVVESAKTFGLKIQDVGAALATLGDNLINGAQAGTRLRMSLSLMAAPSGKAIDQLKSIGIGATQLANDMRQPNGLLVALKDLKTHLEDSGKTASEQAAVLSRAFGGGKSSSVILTLMDQLDRLKAKYGDIGAGARKFGEDWAATQRTVAFQVQQVRAAVDVLAIRIGQALLPAILGIARAVLPAVTAFADFAQKHQELIQAALLLALALGGLGLAIKAVMISMNLARDAMAIYAATTGAVTAVTEAWTIATAAEGAAAAASTPAVAALAVAIDAMLGPVGLVILAAAALVIGFKLLYDHCTVFHNAVNALGSGLKEFVAGAAEKVVGIFNLLHQQFSSAGSILDTLSAKIGMTKGDLLFFVPVIGPIITIFRHWDDIIRGVGQALDWCAEQIHRFLGWLDQMAHQIPVVSGLLDKMGQVGNQVGSVFGAIGSKIGNGMGAAGHIIDVAAGSTEHLSRTMDDVRGHVDLTDARMRHLNTTLDATKGHLKDTADASKKTADSMVSDANRIASAWDKIGKHIAAAGIALAGVIAGQAHAQGAAAASAASAQFGAAERSQHVTALGADPRMDRLIGHAASIDAQIRHGIAVTSLASDKSLTDRQVFSAAGNGMAATSAGMDTALAGFTKAVDKLPSDLAGALGPVIAAYKAQIKALNDKYAADVRSEDQRHIAALAAIQKQHEQAIAAAQHKSNEELGNYNTTHEQALKNHAASVSASLKAHTQSFNQTVSSHVAAIRQANADYQAKVASIHAAYVAQIAGIHGKNAAERKAAATAAYEKHLKAASDELGKRVKADDDAIAKAKRNYDDFLAKNKGNNDSYIARQKQVYDDHIARLKQHRDDSIAAANKQTQDRLAKEDAAHKKHLVDLEKAFKGHAKELEAALKNASSPTGIITALQTQLQKDYDAALNKVTLDFLEHGKASQKDILAVQAVAEMQEKLAAAGWNAAFAVADLATKAQMLSQRFSAVVSQFSAAGQQTQNVQSAQMQIVADRAALQLDALKNIETSIANQTAILQAAAGVAQADAQAEITATTDQTAVLQALAAVTQADAQALISAVKDQTAIIDAQSAVSQAAGSGRLAGIKDQGAIIQAQAAVAQAKDPAALKVAQDQLKIAQETYAADQRQAAFEVRIATDQLRIATDTAAMDRSQAAFDRTIALDQLHAARDTAAANRVAAQWDQKIAADQLVIAKDQAAAAASAATWQQTVDTAKLGLDQANLGFVQAQNKIAVDQLGVQQDIASLLGADDGQAKQYADTLSSDMQGLTLAQMSVEKNTAILASTQQAAAVAAGQQAIQIARDQQVLAADQISKTSDALAWQKKIALDQQQIAADQTAKADDGLSWQQKLAQDQQQLSLDNAAKAQSSIDDQTKIASDQNQQIIDGLAQVATNTAAGNGQDATYYQQIIAKLAALVTSYRTGAIHPMNPALRGSAQQNSFSVDNHSAVMP